MNGPGLEPFKKFVGKRSIVSLGCYVQRIFPEKSGFHAICKRREKGLDYIGIIGFFKLIKVVEMFSVFASGPDEIEIFFRCKGLEDVAVLDLFL